MFKKLFCRNPLDSIVEITKNYPSRWIVDTNEWAFQGLPRDKRYSFEEAWEIGSPFTEVFDNCPKCGSKKETRGDAWQDIEDSGQHMVQISYCPRGCGHNIWVA